MEKKIKIGIIFLIICIIFVSLVMLYLDRGQRIRPPEISELEILIDLKTPDEGTIYIIYPENEISKEDFEVLARASHVAGEILDQYYMLAEEDPFSVKPLRKDGRVTLSLDFFAEDKSEFVGPIYMFESTSWIPFYEEADVTIIFPKGYELLEKETWGMSSKQLVFEYGRWKYFAFVGTFEDFNLEIEYTKSEIDESEN